MPDLPDILSRPLAGHDIRVYFTSRGDLRFFLSDALAALGLPDKGRVTKDLRKEGHIRPLSRQDATETVSRIGLNTLALNSRRGRSFTYTDFLKTLPRRPAGDAPEPQGCNH
jgi:hypothetical protein